MPVDSGLTGVVLQTGRLVATDAPDQDPRFDPEVDTPEGGEATPMLCVPISFRNKTMGVMRVFLESGVPPPREPAKFSPRRSRRRSATQSCTAACSIAWTRLQKRVGRIGRRIRRIRPLGATPFMGFQGNPRARAIREARNHSDFSAKAPMIERFP